MITVTFSDIKREVKESHAYTSAEKAHVVISCIHAIDNSDTQKWYSIKSKEKAFNLYYHYNMS